MFFGKYPQTVVRDKNILEKLGGFDYETWTPFPELHPITKELYSYFKEATLDNESYFGIFYLKNRPLYVDDYKNVGKPYECMYYKGVWMEDFKPALEDEGGYQTLNGYLPNTVYWFKKEKIKWNVLCSDENELTLISDLILDSSCFDSEKRENYADSDIRKWLNEVFFNSAFNEEEQRLICLANLDNGVESVLDYWNKFICQDTQDRVFFLSFREAVYYGDESETPGDRSQERQKKYTDYALARGLCAESYDDDELKSLYGDWLLRSPQGTYKGKVKAVTQFGNIKFASAEYNSIGIVPVIKLKRSNG